MKRLFPTLIAVTFMIVTAAAYPQKTESSRDRGLLLMSEDRYSEALEILGGMPSGSESGILVARCRQVLSGTLPAASERQLTVDSRDDFSVHAIHPGGGRIGLLVSGRAERLSVSGLPEWARFVSSGDDVLWIDVDPNTAGRLRVAEADVTDGKSSVHVFLPQDIVLPADRAALLAALSQTLLRADTLVSGDLLLASAPGRGSRMCICRRASDGMVYMGGWSDGRMTGKGIMIWPDGYHGPFPTAVFYAGSVSSGLPDGLGSSYSAHGVLLYDGRMNSGKPAGEPAERNADTGDRFEIVTLNDGSMYAGQTRDGLIDGMGVYVAASGDMWFGTWTRGERTGHGMYVTPEGTVLSGEWSGGVMR